MSPVEPATIMRAYCTSEGTHGCGDRQCTVSSGSGSISGEVEMICGSDIDGRAGTCGIWQCVLTLNLGDGEALDRLNLNDSHLMRPILYMQCPDYDVQCPQPGNGDATITLASSDGDNCHLDCLASVVTALGAEPIPTLGRGTYSDRFGLEYPRAQRARPRQAYI